MSSHGHHLHHNTSKQHKNRDGKKRYRSSNTSQGSTETPYKRNKNNSVIGSPYFFEFLDQYPDMPHSRRSNDRDHENILNSEDDSILLITRVLKNIDNLEKKLDSYHVKVKNVDTRICDVESAFSSVDVKLDINHKLLKIIL